MSSGGSLSAFVDDVRSAVEVLLAHVKTESPVSVISHLDADGLSSAGILGKLLQRLDIPFRIRIEKNLDEKSTKDIGAEKAPLTILSDMGGGSLDLLARHASDSKMIVLDHHQPSGEALGLLHVNPMLHGFDGGREISGAGVTYFFAREIDRKNVDLAYLGIVGALGDSQDKNPKKVFVGLNNTIVEDAVSLGSLEVKVDLAFFGRETRPLHKALSSTTDPFIPGLSGDESGSLSFLANLNIPLRDESRWRTPSELTTEEKQRLYSELAKLLSSKNTPNNVISNLIGNVYTLTREDRLTPFRDAREFSSLLNSCGRMDKAGIGVAIAMGNRTEQMREALETYNEYRRRLANYVEWALAPETGFKEMRSIYLLDGRGKIEDRMVGAVASILALSGPFSPLKPIIALSQEEDETVKISGRSSGEAVSRGLNLGKVLSRAAKTCEGLGGGHDIAAGAQIPIGRLALFVETVSDLVEKSLAH